MASARLHYYAPKRWQDVRITKAMCGAECWTDHKLMVCKLDLRILPCCCPQGTKPPKCINISKLNVPRTRESLTNAIDNNLSSLSSISSDIEGEWAAFRDSVYSAANDVRGAGCRKHEDWLDENNFFLNPVFWMKSAYTTRLSSLINSPSGRRHCMTKPERPYRGN